MLEKCPQSTQVSKCKTGTNYFSRCLSCSKIHYILKTGGFTQLVSDYTRTTFHYVCGSSEDVL